MWKCIYSQNKRVFYVLNPMDKYNLSFALNATSEPNRKYIFDIEDYIQFYTAVCEKNIRNNYLYEWAGEFKV